MGLRDLAGWALLAMASAVQADEPNKPPPSSAAAGRHEDDRGRTERTTAEQFAQILADFDARRAAYRQASAKAGNSPDQRKLAAKMAPDEVDYCHRIVDLAASAPGDPAARDALLWVIDKPGRRDTGAYGDEFARAAALLVRHHGDDPEAVRIGLQLENVRSFHREELLRGFYAAAKHREAKGLARMALAHYLSRAASDIDYYRKVPGRPKVRYLSGGKTQEIEMPDDWYAYSLHLRQCDPAAVRSEVERLYEEVIAEYGDVPYITRRDREREARLKGTGPRWNGKPLTDEDRRQLERRLALKRTLEEVAVARLDEMYNLVVGKPAPEIDGTGMDGGRLKLSDYRGKVVVLVFWGTWCGPCMSEVPHEREMVERLKGRPFALLGVDCDDDEEKAKKVMERERMTWPNWFDGAPGAGPIVGRYHVRSYPTIFVLDSKGIIRFSHLRGEPLDQAVDKLLQEAEQPAPEQGTSRPALGKSETPES